MAKRQITFFLVTGVAVASGFTAASYVARSPKEVAAKGTVAEGVNGALAKGSPAAAAIDPATTAATAPLARDNSSSSLALLTQGLEALSMDRFDDARAIREQLPKSSLDAHLLTWALAYFGGAQMPSGDIAAAARDLPGWPGKKRMRDNSERALYRENPPAKTVLAVFGASAPQTWQGGWMLARAHLELGDAAKARISIAPFWHSEPLDAVTEAAILTQFGTVLTKGDHRLRLEAMLYGGRNGSAERIAERAGAKELTQAWIAASRRAPNALTLIDAVPAEQSSTGLIFAKARLLRQLRRYREAAKVMRSLPKDPLTNAGSRQWWTERRLLSRLLLDQGDAKLAYEVAANHGATNPVDIADAEFHAGWYGLRQLRDADKAEPHFRRILAVADGPISRARAHYWLGRAAEAAGQSGEEHYRRASRYGTTFSGQLASAKLGLKTLTLTSPTVSEADRARFASREAVFAIERLEQAGHGWRAHALYIALAEELNSPGELALLASMAQKSGNHHMALKVAKAAANRGMDVGALTHPVGAVPPGAMIDGAGSALVYAIARQESEFNTGAVSPAGARGLLQLMPQTAQSLAGQSGLTYSAERLTNDVAFNAQLGSQFLAEQLGRFDGSYVLTFAGYNAGPSRARQWMEKYGDPRGKSVEEIVDWIERIPFQETRAYVQRVMENYQVYKAQLTGQSDIEADLRIGRK